MDNNQPVNPTSGTVSTQPIPAQPEPTVTPPAPTSPVTPPPVGDGSKKMVLFLIGGLIVIILVVGGIYYYLGNKQQTPAVVEQVPTPTAQPQTAQDLETELNTTVADPSLDTDFSSVDKEIESL